MRGKACGLDQFLNFNIFIDYPSMGFEPEVCYWQFNQKHDAFIMI